MIALTEILSVNSEKIKGEIKSVEIPKVGKVEYNEYFIGLSKPRKEALRLQGLEGYRVKRVLSLPPQLQGKANQFRERIKEGYGNLRLGNIRGEGFSDIMSEHDVEGVLYILDNLTHSLRDYTKFSEQLRDQILQIEYVLSEGSCPAWGTAQHGIMGDYWGEWQNEHFSYGPDNYRLSVARKRKIMIDNFFFLKKSSILFSSYRGGKDMLSTFWVSAPMSPFYHFSPLVFVYGNKNPLFTKYLEGLLESPSDAKLERMLNTAFSFGGKDLNYSRIPLSDYSSSLFLSNNFLFTNKEQKSFLEKEGGLYKPHNTKGEMQLLLQRRPFEREDVAIPIISGYSNFPEFRMGSMAECIVNFPDQIVILPVAEK